MGNHKEENENIAAVGFGAAALPLVVVILILIYGMMLRPVVFEQIPLSLEIVFLVGILFASVQLLILKHKWSDIFKSATDKIAQAMPTLLILLAIGMIIGSWIVSGTLPMFVYYGIKMINPDYIYLISFIIPVIFSTMTGTSWGSVSTVGVVLMGVAITVNADLAITAAAIIGGSFFGDKLSPLSDTTNIASVAVDVSVYDHIKSMLYTTIPAALIAAIAFLIFGFIFPAEPPAATSVVPVTLTVSESAVSSPNINETLSQIERSFNFNLLLLLPPIVVLWGSVKKYPTVPVLIISSILACVLALFFQDFNIDQVSSSLINGFNTEMIRGVEVNPVVSALFTRGGLYSLKEPFIISIFVFAYVGIIGRIDAMTVVVNNLFSWIKSRGGVVRAALLSSAIVNALTSNQYANSFIVGDAFKKKFDEKDIDRRVLSRSLEDTGTMIESIVPWHTTCLFIVSTLGVAVGDYWYYQIFTLSNILVAFLFTYLGIAIFRRNEK